MTTSDLSDVCVTPEVTGPMTSTETILAEVLAGIVGVERVSADSDFFNDLGADSMLMARFCARLRKQTDLPSVSMKDIYRHPTVRTLAVALADAGPATAEPSSPPSVQPATRATTGQYLICGTLQCLFFLGYSCLGALVLAGGYEWISAGSGWVELYWRSVLFGGVTFLGLAALPILVKWMLIGRWTSQQIPIWTLAYFRFWIVKALVHSNPLILFAGSPLYVLYLRALGANIGRDVTILSRIAPVCTDLLTIGDGTVIRKDSVFSCYRGHAGLIEIGPVTLGKGVVVSEATVLDINTSLGDGAQLGHASALHAGQSVPAGEHWHGSPAQLAEVDYRAIDPAECGALRRAVYSVLQLVYLLALDVPLAVGGIGILVDRFPRLTALLDSGRALTTAGFYVDALVASFVVFFGGLFLGLLAVATVPRLLNLAIEPGKAYPLYGFHYGLYRAISRMTNLRFFLAVFGDSSYVVHYLGSLGYHLTPVVQTGSNFGTNLKHETPFLSSVGSGTMVSDGLSIMNADFSSTSFRLSPVSIGPRNFIGNTVAYPAQGKTGDNCLLGTKVMVPIDGTIREHVGLLGSPCFEIPRSVQRDTRFDHLATGEEFRRRLAAKNRYNLRTMGLFLLVRWMHFFFVALIALSAARVYDRFGISAVMAVPMLIVFFSAAYSILVERATTKFGSLRPRFCSIYEQYFWFHERYWKLLADIRIINLFNGTPFKGLLWRLAGVRMGRRVFDDGCYIPERTLAVIGDDCTLNARSDIQCHSQEDGTFKSDRITIGAGCTVGIGALVHYGVTMGDGAVLEADSFLMKGEEVPSCARWGGNPARPVGVPG